MKNITYKIVQWSTPEELHAECLEWVSQLKFIRDEQRFLDELIKKYTISLILKDVYEDFLKLVGELKTEEKELAKLLKRVKEHKNNIEVLLDRTIDEREGAAYKEIHYYLKVEVYSYNQKYRKIKSKLFKKIKEFMKRERRKLQQ
jgi:hypothetical protein